MGAYIKVSIDEVQEPKGGMMVIKRPLVAL